MRTHSMKYRQSYEAVVAARPDEKKLIHHAELFKAIKITVKHR